MDDAHLVTVKIVGDRYEMLVKNTKNRFPNINVMIVQKAVVTLIIEATYRNRNLSLSFIMLTQVV